MRTTYPPELKTILNVDAALESRQWLSRWPELSTDPTPLYELPGLAEQLDISRLSVKDESVRSPLGSFKALGAPIALVREVLRRYPDFDPQHVLAGRYADTLKQFTVISATDGNHGRSLAAAARDAGCQCMIVLHAKVSEEREDAIAAYGARIIRIAGNYDESVVEAARLSAEHGWQVISDTSYAGYEDIPRDVMQGYGIISEEIIQQGSKTAGETAYTHVFLQGGVGGFPAGIIADLWERTGVDRPHFIIVEPGEANCLVQSALHGGPVRANGSVDSLMAGLACGEASPLAWRILDAGVDHFMTVDDGLVSAAMQRLARGSERDIPIVAGESGVAGLIGLEVLRGDPVLSERAGLDASSRVLVINTEGATAPSVYEELVGATPASVLQRQVDWLARAGV